MKKDTFVYQGTTFRKGTPLELCELLLKLRESKTRVVFDFGNTKTNKSWEERYDIAGRIGRSTGTQPILILLNKSTSTGGGAISTNCVLSIRESKGKKLIYQHKL